MEPTYWVTLENDVAGPFTFDQLVDYVSEGRLDGSHQICEDGTETWFPLSQLVQAPARQAPAVQATSYRPGTSRIVAGTVAPLAPQQAAAGPIPYQVKSTTSSAQIVVIFIIVGVAALAGWFIFKGVAESREIDPEQLASTKKSFTTILNALDSYQKHSKVFPTKEQGLDALVSKPKTEPIPEDWKPFLKGRVVDGWGNEIVYRPPDDPTGVPLLISPGRDGEIGTDDDMSSKDKD